MQTVDAVVVERQEHLAGAFTQALVCQTFQPLPVRPSSLLGRQQLKFSTLPSPRMLYRHVQ